MNAMDQSPISASEPFEFPCVGCGQALRVQGETAGRQAKCPRCGVQQDVPHSSAPPLIRPPENRAPVIGPSGSYAAAPPREDAFPLADANPAPAPAAEGAFSSTVSGGAAAPTSLSLDPSHLTDESRSTPTKELFDRITNEIAKIYIGQQELVLGTLIALFSGGHVLIESVPGLGKTLFVRTLGRVLGCEFGRIQFTADLMPSDITGAPVFNMKTQEFAFRPGPVFTQILLADEINRSPAKTHAALLEIMQEFRVTVDGVSHPIEQPFLVMATQNPIESEGTYNLPEAQLDRFMFKLIADYPSEHEEANILEDHGRQIDINQRLVEEIQEISSPAEVLSITRANGMVRVDPKLIDYINKIVRLTRQWPQIHMGASPRAGLALLQGARTLAAFCGRDYAVPDDVVQLAKPALRHRVILTAEAEVEGHSVDDLLTQLIRTIEVPRI